MRRAFLATRTTRASLSWLPHLVFEVTDTGVGIKEEDLPRLFQGFVQLEATATMRNEGSGLSLALTKQLVELHGGRIWAESPGDGLGSTFTVLLPFGGTAKTTKAAPPPAGG